MTNIMKPVHISLFNVLLRYAQRPKVRPSINREVSNEFRPSPWITDVIPRKSPFVPQMGDEVCMQDAMRKYFTKQKMYKLLKQMHKIYLNLNYILRVLIKFELVFTDKPIW